jgi:hypothetical protein
MYFPVSGLELNPLILVISAFVISALCSTAGISGAFLLLPFQFSVLNFVSPSVSSTNQVFNVLSTPGGVYRYIREGRFVWKLSKVLILGLVPGIAVGTIIRIMILPEPSAFKIFAGLMLLVIAVQMIYNFINNKNEETNSIHAEIVQNEKINNYTIQFSYDSRFYKINIFKLILLSILVGTSSGIYGIGGGVFLSTFLIAFFRLPVKAISGSILFCTFISSVTGVLSSILISLFMTRINVNPDLIMALFFGIGGLIGSYTGARLQKYLPVRFITILLIIIILFISISYIFNIY